MRVLRGALAAGLLAGLGCGEEQAAPITAELAPPTPPQAEIVQQEAHVATFVDEELDECISLMVGYVIPPAATDWEPPPIDALAAAFTPEQGQGREVVHLRKSCEEQFAGRTVLASCGRAGEAQPVEGAPDGVVRTVAIVAEGFRFETSLDSDVRMRDCLAMGGEWAAAAEDSREYRRARLEHVAGQADRAARALQDR